MKILTKIFSGTTDPRIETLRDCVNKNMADSSWADSFSKRWDALEKDAESALSKFADSGSKTDAEKFIAAHLEIQKRDALDQLYRKALGISAARILARTIPALRDALSAVKSRLEDELENVRKTDAERAAEFGLAQEESSITKILAGEIQKADRFSNSLQSLDAYSMGEPIKFCLGD